VAMKRFGTNEKGLVEFGLLNNGFKE